MRVVLDANVVVSGIFWSGPPQIILKSWLKGSLTLVASGPILAEYRDVLYRMADKQGGDIVTRWNRLLTELSECVEPRPLAVACRDPKDQKYLEAAVAGQVRCLISGDKDLLILGAIDEIPIVTPKAFLIAFRTP